MARGVALGQRQAAEIAEGELAALAARDLYVAVRHDA